VLLSEHRVLESVEQACERFHICSERIFLIGADCGGTMALRLAMMHPELFAGVVSIGGAFPQGDAPLARIRQARRLQILIEHGRGSSTYREAALCEDLRLLHVAGMSITLRQYPSDDEITRQMLADVDSWIMQQIAGTCVGSDESSDPSFYRHN
jgi:phospholipase/carboxylesterase